MAKVKIAAFDTLAPGEDTDSVESSISGVRTQIIFGGARDPIHARLHHLAPGARGAWTGGQVGCVVYVWQGVAAAGAVRLPAGSATVIEHGAEVEISAEDGCCTLLVFNRAPGRADAPRKAGGQVHLLPADHVPRSDKMVEHANYGGAIFADSACPTCELWLHESRFFEPGHHVEPHYHSEDEVIVVVRGSIVLGTRTSGRGTAVAIAKGTIYSFHAGPGGLDFINFRPFKPTYAVPGAQRVVDEQAFYIGKLGHPPYLSTAGG